MALEADAVRIVLFEAPSIPANVLDLWQRVMGAPPQGFQQPPQPGAAIATGNIANLQGALILQPGRLELNLTSPGSAGGGPPTGIADVAAAVSRAASLGRKLLGARRANRIGLVIELSESAIDAAGAVARFLRELPFLQVPPDASDLLFQINRQVTSSVPGVNINRLCRWGTAVKQTVQMQLPTDAPTQSLVLSSTHVLTIAFDVNTTPHQNPYTGKQSNTLLAELVQQSSQLMSKGYAQLT